MSKQTDGHWLHLALRTRSKPLPHTPLVSFSFSPSIPEGTSLGPSKGHWPESQGPQVPR